MANFLLNILESDAITITNVIETSTECAGLFQFDVEAEQGSSINIAFGAKAKNKVIVLNEVESNVSGFTESVLFNNSLTVRFSVDNSGIPGVFDSAEVVLDEGDPASSVSYTGIRNSDSPKCESIQPSFDDLSDTPETKIGEENKYLRVSDDGSLIVFDDLEIIDPITVTEANGGLNPGELAAGSSIEDILRTILEKPIPPTVSLDSVPIYEKGVFNNIIINYSITNGTAGDVVSVTSNLGIVYENAGFVEYISSETIVADITVNFSSESITANKTVNFYPPQWYGASSETDLINNYVYDGYPGQGLTKLVQSSPLIDAQFTCNDEYIYLVSTQNNLTVKDGNGYIYNDFTITQVSATTADYQLETMYQYRTIEKKTLSNFNFKLVY